MGGQLGYNLACRATIRNHRKDGLMMLFHNSNPTNHGESVAHRVK
jgi:hypothetical protein